MINYIIYFTFILTLINFITLFIFVYVGQQQNLNTRKFNDVDVEGTLKVRGGDINNETGVAHYTSQDNNGAVISGQGNTNDFLVKNNNLDDVFLVKTNSQNTTFNGDVICTNGTLNLENGTTVTQNSSKATAVTVNDFIGRIITHNEELQSGSGTFFTVNNNLVTDKDHIHITLSGSAANNYLITIQYIDNGLFRLGIVNNNISSLSDNVNINFMVLRGSIN